MAGFRLYQIQPDAWLGPFLRSLVLRHQCQPTLGTHGLPTLQFGSLVLQLCKPCERVEWVPPSFLVRFLFEMFRCFVLLLLFFLFLVGPVRPCFHLSLLIAKEKLNDPLPLASRQSSQDKITKWVCFSWKTNIYDVLNVATILVFYPSSNQHGNHHHSLSVNSSLHPKCLQHDLHHYRADPSIDESAFSKSQTCSSRCFLFLSLVTSGWIGDGSLVRSTQKLSNLKNV